MRLFVIVICIAGCGASDFVPADHYAGELLRNGDFEAIDATGWIAEWDNMDSNPDGQIVVVTEPHHSGTYALQWQIDATDGYEYWVMQHGLTAAQLQAGHRYELTGWYMVDHAGDIAINYIVRGEPGDAPDLGTVSDPITPPTVANEWEPFHYEFDIPSGAAPATYDVWLHSIKFTGTPVNLTLDGVSLHPL